MNRKLANLALVSALVLASATSAHAQRIVPVKQFPTAPPPPYLTQINTYAGLPGTPGNYDGRLPYFATLNGPTVIATDGAGSTWVFDAQNNVFRNIGNGAVVTRATTTTLDPWISGLAVDPATQDLYYTDSFANGVYKVDGTGTVTLIAGGDPRTYPLHDDPNGLLATFFKPAGIVRDAAGNLFVADTNNCALRMITPPSARRPTYAVTTLATGVAGFCPTSLAMDPQTGYFYAVSGYGAIYMVSPAGAVSLYAGDNNVRDHIDGNVTTARFNNPQGLAVDSAHNVFVGDYDLVWDQATQTFAPHGSIRQISPGKYFPGGLEMYPATVTTITYPGTHVSFTLQQPTGLALWGTALLVTDPTQDTVDILQP